MKFSTGQFHFADGITLPLLLQISILGPVHRWRLTMDSEDSSKTSALDLHALAWSYAQKTGELQQDGKHVATGYSGSGSGKNNPEMQQIRNVGPIPQGDWTIVGPPINTAEHGPYVLALKPAPDTNTFCREGFLMHGDSVQSPGAASQGCIILARTVREQVWNSDDRDLKVVAEMRSDAPEEE
jgi:hypothetical protein